MNNTLTTLHGLPSSTLPIDKATAFHLAGQAVAICRGNQQKQLPEVYFQILLNQSGRDKTGTDGFSARQGLTQSRIIGGQLIHHLPLSLADTLKGMPRPQQDEYICAFEADIINLLAGPLAESKYIAIQRNKTFHASLANLIGLSPYYRRADLSLLIDYMNSFLTDHNDYEKLKLLLLETFSFVNHQANWRMISSVAGYILNKPASSIDCEEVIYLIESRIAA